MKTVLFTSAACCLCAALSIPASAQPMVYTTTPLQANGDRFFESTNMHWSLRGPNFFASFGGPNIGVPRFGGYNPNAGISSGWAFNSARFSGNFRFNFSQGYERFSTTTVPSLMTTNGQTGQFFSGVRRPFVYSLVPVIPPGGAFFSTPIPGIHQQLHQAGTIADRVQRGEIVLPESTSTVGTRAMVHTAIDDATTARVNSAFAWFNESSRRALTPAQQASIPENSSGIPSPEGSPATNELIAIASKFDIPITEATPSATDSSSQKITEVYFQRGLEAVKQSNIPKARFLLRMAQQRATGELRKSIETHISELPVE